MAESVLLGSNLFSKIASLIQIMQNQNLIKNQQIHKNIANLNK